METFVVYADWSTGEPVTDEVLAAVNTAWPAADESVCSSVKSGVLRLSFDVVGRDLDEAAAKARDAVEGLREQTDLTGRLARLVIYTEEAELDLPIE